MPLVVHRLMWPDIHTLIDPPGARNLLCGHVAWLSKEGHEKARRAYLEGDATLVSADRTVSRYDYERFRDAPILEPGQISEDPEEITCMVCLVALSRR
jgi:hypothetical protein